MNKRLLVSLIVFIITTAVINGYLLGWLPLPLIITDTNISSLIIHYKPITYVAYNDEFDKCIVSYKLFSTYNFNNIIAIEYWYHWNYDGFKHVDDWEPVIVYISNNNIIAIAHRVHYQWRVKTTGIIIEDDRPVILFLPLWHTPLNSYPSDIGYEMQQYNIVLSSPPEMIDPVSIYLNTYGYRIILIYTLISLVVASIVAFITYEVQTLFSKRVII